MKPSNKNNRTSSKRHNDGKNPIHSIDKQSNMKTYIVQEPMELLAFLLKNISNQGRNATKSMLARGQIQVDNEIITAYNYLLQPKQNVIIRRDRITANIPLIGLHILFEDEDIIVINKDAGLLSIASDKEKSELTAYRQLMAYVRQKNPNHRIFVVHRLDRDTSGVIMYAKSEAIQQRLQQTWNVIVKERTYIALVEGKVKQSKGIISSWLKESSTLKMYSSPTPNGGQHAVTHYSVIQSNRNYSLLEVNLETGRKNQIRVHMQDMGHSIVGDKKYGAKSKAIGRLGLHARVLAFEHPATGKLMRFETDIPKVFLNPFRNDNI